jgi:hypothetical protein
MNNTEHVERHLERTLAVRAGSVAPSAALSAERVIAAGMVARRRRRQGRVLAVATAVVALAVAAGTLTQVRGATTTPVPPGSPPPSTASTTSPPLGGVPVGSVGLAVISGSRVVLPDGTQLTLPLPDGYTAGEATQVPSGWVYTGYRDAEGFSLYFGPNGGQPIRMGSLFGNYVVSGDGRTLVAGAVNGANNTVVAYELPSLRQIASVTVEAGLGPVVDGIGGDWVVFRNASGDGSPTAAYTWNVRTHTLHPASATVNVWGVSRDGHVLRRVLMDQQRGCLDLVTMGAFPTVGPTGVCSDHLSLDEAFDGRVSPDGLWAFVRQDGLHNPVLLRTADIHSGRWLPVTTALPENSRALFWDTDSTFIGQGPDDRYYRCSVPGGQCVTLVLPSGLGEQPHILPNTVTG